MANPVLNGGYASPQSIYSEYGVAATNQSRAQGYHPVGTRGTLPDGRVFYYASNGAVALTTGSLLVGSALSRSGNHDKIVLTASFANWSAGKQNGIVLGNTDLDTSDIITNEYQDGFVAFENAAGQGGYSYKIKGHTQGDASATGTTTGAKFDLYDPLVGTAVATDEITLCRNRHDRVITSTTAEEELAVGVAPIAVTASTALATDVTTAEAATDTYFFWAQTWGPCAVEVDDTTIALGIACTSGDTADRMEAALLIASTGATPTISGYDIIHTGVGMVPAVAAAGDFAIVDLRICP
jgi:hypothetical protein